MLAAVKLCNIEVYVHTHVGEWVIVGVEAAWRCLKVQNLVQTKREVNFHNEVKSEHAFEMGVYVQKHKRTENVKIRS